MAEITQAGAARPQPGAPASEARPASVVFLPVRRDRTAGERRQQENALLRLGIDRARARSLLDECERLRRRETRRQALAIILILAAIALAVVLPRVLWP